LPLGKELLFSENNSCNPMKKTASKVLQLVQSWYSGSKRELVIEKLKGMEPEEIQSFLNKIGNDETQAGIIEKRDINKINAGLSSLSFADKIKAEIVFDAEKRCQESDEPPAGVRYPIEYMIIEMTRTHQSLKGSHYGLYKILSFSSDSEEYVVSGSEVDAYRRTRDTPLHMGMFEGFISMLSGWKLNRHLTIKADPIVSAYMRLAKEETIVSLNTLKNYPNHISENQDEFLEHVEQFIIRFRENENVPSSMAAKHKEFADEMQSKLEEVKDYLVSSYNEEQEKEIEKQKSLVKVPGTIYYHRAAKDYHVLCHIIDKQDTKSITIAQLKRLQPRLAQSLLTRPEFKNKFGSSTKPFTSAEVRDFEETLERGSHQIVRDEWPSDLQRSVKGIPGAQTALAIVASPQMIGEMKRKHCYELFEDHQYTSHPHAGGKDQLGWLRVEVDTHKKILLVDEAQSDYEEVTSKFITKKPKVRDYQELFDDYDTYMRLRKLADDYCKEKYEIRLKDLSTNREQDKVMKLFVDQVNQEEQEKYETIRKQRDKENEELGPKSPENKAKALNSIMQQFPHIAVETAVQFAKSNGLKTIYWHEHKSGNSIKGSDAPEVMYKDIPEQNHFKLVHDEHPFGLDGDFYKREAFRKLVALARKWVSLCLYKIR
jgi:hypothetical protein